MEKIATIKKLETKQQIARKLRLLFKSSGAAEVAEEAGCTRQSAHQWLMKPGRESIDIRDAALRVIEREEKVLAFREGLSN